jgi:hypothetical protein
VDVKILTQEQKEFFDDNGFLVIPKMYSESEMVEMRDQFHDLIANTEGRPETMKYAFMEPDPEYGVDPYNPKNVRGIMDQPLANDYWFNNVTDPRIVNVFVDLFGPDIDFHNGKVRNNPPGFSNDQSWHQDWPYEKHSKPELAAAIIYLDETDVDAGATSVVAGSHKQGEWETVKGHTIGNELVSEDRVVMVKAQPGDVVFIHVLVVHSAGHNYTKQSRHKIINEYKSHQAVDRWGNKCAFAGLPLARNGELVIPQI